MSPVWHPLVMALETAGVLVALLSLMLGVSLLGVRAASRTRGPRPVRGPLRD
jgi:hypothetical protein